MVFAGGAPQTEKPMSEPDTVPRRGPWRRASRFWLFAPYVALALIAAGWSTAWFIIRDHTIESLDAWIEQERDLGRQWSCAERSVGGFPFRVEVVCPRLSLAGPDFAVAIGRVIGVAQVYQPGLIIVEASGPLTSKIGPTSLEGTWRPLQASIRTSADGIERLSLVVEAPSIRASGLPKGDLALSARRTEVHLRPDPAIGSAEQAYDVSLRTDGAAVPALDAVLGTSDPVDLLVEAKLTRVPVPIAGPLIDEVERWRLAGGRIDLALLRFAKGQARLEGAGQISLDELHRPAGAIKTSGAGLQAILVPLVGPAAALLGGLLGGSAPAQANPAGRPGPGPVPKTLPPLRLEGGRVFLGPLTLPNVRLQPLY